MRSGLASIAGERAMRPSIANMINATTTKVRIGRARVGRGARRAVISVSIYSAGLGYTHSERWIKSEVVARRSARCHRQQDDVIPSAATDLLSRTGRQSRSL